MELFRKYYDILVYLIFGVLTTLVNYAVYLPCFHLLGFSASVSNVIAWAAAVIFAFVTNKPSVFRSFDWSRDVVLPEFTKVTATRLGSGALETVILFLAVDLLRWDGTLWKLITSVLVVVLNYVGSKLLVFKK